ncbi:unnamed protein product [Clonostachys rhizophaga]|uniref:Uncharacterized protein n=1 Tax=Clonostachys rhizophaga TaxID=160324 RepID=A0A9N9VPJ8_9HYPO|nr:unnamed protein product [Clonostachys rhizophaga]
MIISEPGALPPGQSKASSPVSRLVATCDEQLKQTGPSFTLRYALRIGTAARHMSVWSSNPSAVGAAGPLIRQPAAPWRRTAAPNALFSFSCPPAPRPSPERGWHADGGGISATSCVGRPRSLNVRFRSEDQSGIPRTIFQPQVKCECLDVGNGPVAPCTGGLTVLEMPRLSTGTRPSSSPRAGKAGHGGDVIGPVDVAMHEATPPSGLSVHTEACMLWLVQANRNAWDLSDALGLV